MTVWERDSNCMLGWVMHELLFKIMPVLAFKLSGIKSKVLFELKLCTCIGGEIGFSGRLLFLALQ